MDGNRLNTDQPQVDQDLYNRKPFAELLTGLLVLPQASQGLVVGIEGAWGTGKTTVVRHIVAALKGRLTGQPIIVEFNPWMLAGADALVEALLTELASGIGMDGQQKGAKKALDVAQKVLGYAGLLRHLKYLKYVPGVSLAGVTAEAVGTALHALGGAAEKFGDGTEQANKVVEEAEKLVSVQVGLAERKRQVTDALSQLDRSIVVIVDDIDRLTPEEIKAVFRTIKAVADFPRVTYLLAYDRAVVAESLGGKDAVGNAYIEKIVQVAYPITPAFPWQLKAHLEKELDSLFTRIQRKKNTFETEFLPRAVTLAHRLCSTPRDIARLTNRLTLSLASTIGEVNSADVIVAEALFQRFPTIREAIVKNPEDFTGFHWSTKDEMASADWSMFLSGNKEERLTRWQGCLPSEQELNDRKAATAALNFLFPMTQGVATSPKSHLRMSDTSRLIRYFAATSISGVHEVADIHRMLASPVEIAEMLIQADAPSATEIVNHLTAYLETSPVVDEGGVMTSVAKASIEFNVKAQIPREFSHAAATLASSCILRTEGSAGALARNFVAIAPLVVGFDFAQTISMSHGQVRGVDEWKISQAPRYTNDPDAVKECISAWRERASRLFEEDTVLLERDLFTVLYGLSNLGANSRVQDAIGCVKKLCLHRKRGLRYFLHQAEPFKELRRELFFLYVWDVDAMANLVESTHLDGDYSWYIKALREDESIRLRIKNRDAPPSTSE